MSSSTHLNPAAVRAAIEQRKTLKVLGDADDMAQVTAEAAERNQPLVLDSLRVAGWAPFHFARNSGGLAEPWRAHVLWHPSCRLLAPKLLEWFPEMSPSNKLTRMLYACGAMVLVTWIPQFYGLSDRKEAQVSCDEEHLAAASAMVQNLLLMLTSHGMGTYWSSGGRLGSQSFFDRVGIPSQERLLAAVFIEFPETLEDPRERLPGKNRRLRSDGWIREISTFRS